MALSIQPFEQLQAPELRDSAGAAPVGKKPLDAKLAQAREFISRGDYAGALRILPADSKNAEIKNAAAVCLIRLGQFEKAIAVLRSVALNSAFQTVREETPEHIRINYAIALVFGGRPAGGLDVLNGVGSAEHRSVRIVHEAIRVWVSEMSFFRKIDWKLNRIAPANPPAPPIEKLGEFIWDVA